MNSALARHAATACLLSATFISSAGRLAAAEPMRPSASYARWDSMSNRAEQRLGLPSRGLLDLRSDGPVAHEPTFGTIRPDRPSASDLATRGSHRDTITGHWNTRQLSDPVGSATRADYSEAYQSGFPPAVVASWGITLSGVEHYAAPNGGGAGSDGSINDPWELQYAMDGANGRIHPGDVVWLRGGTYYGNYQPHNPGAPGAPIIFRQYPNELASLRSPTPCNMFGQRECQAIDNYSPDLWFWGFEVMSDSTTQMSLSCGNVLEDMKGAGITQWAARTKLINLIIHDVYSGIGQWQTASEGESYGNILYYGGYQVACNGRGSTHNLYSDGAWDGSHTIFNDNISFWAASQNLRIDSWATNVEFSGNIAFMAGRNMLAPWGERNFWFGTSGGDYYDAAAQLRNNVIDSNSSYYDELSDPVLVNEGFNVGTWDAAGGGVVFTNNYIAGGSDKALYFGYYNQVTGAPCSGNTVWGNVPPYVQTQCPSSQGNVFTGTSKPTQNFIRVRPNKYEPGRANIAVYNWRLLPSVTVDLTNAGLKDGQSYVVKDAENFFAAPVATGTYSSSSPSVVIPMTGLTIVPPVATDYTIMPWHTAPEFGAFVVLPTSTVTGGSGGSGGSGGTGAPGPLPAGWTNVDIAAVGGSASYTSGAFTVRASGADVWGTSDSFNYTYQPFSGDGYIVARVVSQQNTSLKAKAGVMFRESTATDAAEVVLDVIPYNGSGGVELLVRPANGAATQYVTGTFSNPLPVWLKLARSGSTFTAYVSTDGTNWSTFGTTTATMGTGATVGLATTSHDATQIGVATYDNVAVAPAGPSGPPVPPPPPGPGCTAVSVSPVSVTIPLAGGTSDVTVTGTCAWGWQSNNPGWLVSTAGSYTATSATVTLKAAAAKTKRSGTVTIAGQTVKVVQQ